MKELEFSEKWMNLYLPPIMQSYENSTNIKKLITSYCKAKNKTDKNYIDYGNIQDVENNIGSNLDATGKLFNVYRRENETDALFRERIKVSAVNKLYNCSIVDQNKLLKYYIPQSNLEVIDNPDGQMATIKLRGQSSLADYQFGVDLIQQLKAGGVKLLEEIIISEEYLSNTKQFGNLVVKNKRIFEWKP